MRLHGILAEGGCGRRRHSITKGPKGGPVQEDADLTLHNRHLHECTTVDGVSAVVLYQTAISPEGRW